MPVNATVPAVQKVKRLWTDSLVDALNQFFTQGNNLRRITATIDFAAIAAGAAGTETINTPPSLGVKTGDQVIAMPPANINIGLVVRSCVATADNVITLAVQNLTGSTIDAPSGVWTFLVVKNVGLEVV